MQVCQHAGIPVCKYVSTRFMAIGLVKDIKRSIWPLIWDQDELSSSSDSQDMRCSLVAVVKKSYCRVTTTHLKIVMHAYAPESHLLGAMVWTPTSSTFFDGRFGWRLQVCMRYTGGARLFSLHASQRSSTCLDFRLKIRNKLRNRHFPRKRVPILHPLYQLYQNIKS